MTFWPAFWTVTFAAALGSFTILAIVVAIGGAFEVGAMLALRDSHREASSSPNDAEGSEKS